MIENNYTTIDFADNYKTVAADAFRSSHAFNNAVIGIKFKNIQTIEKSAFHRCSNLQRIELGGENQTTDEKAIEIKSQAF
jgi:hypothetical protein